MRRVPPLNQHFTVGKREAGSLWANADGMPEYTDRQFDFDRIRRSQDGRWVLRHQRPHDAQKQGEIAARELQFLQRLGLATVSFAYIPLSERRLLTIVPWISQLTDCDDQRYAREVKPTLRTYYDLAQGRPNVPYLSQEISLPEQYSVLETTGTVFLRDVEPSVHSAGPSLARALVKRLTD